MIPDEASLLRLYLNADDRWQGQPLYEAVVTQARSLGLAGASVFLGELGYGRHRVIHDARSEYSFVAQPVVIEIIDAPERLNTLLAAFQSMVGNSLVTVSTLSSVRVARYGHCSEPGGTA